MKLIKKGKTVPVGYRLLRTGEITKHTDIYFHSKPDRWEAEGLPLRMLFLYTGTENVPMARKQEANHDDK